MDEPQRSRWTLSLVAGAAVLAVLLIVMVIGVVRQRQAQRAVAPASVSEAPSPADDGPPTPAPPLIAPPLGQKDIVAAASQAAEAYAAGQPYGAANRDLIGKRFEVVLPFGCAGPNAAPSTEPAYWDFDLVKKTITVAAQPQVWTGQSWTAAIVGPGKFERLEGFWIPRPWLATPSCPAPRAPEPGDLTPSPTAPSVGLMQIFGPETARTGQNGSRPYRAVLKASDEELTTARREFRLTLSGRVSGFSSGDAVRCHSVSINTQPTCMVAVTIDQLELSDPVDSKQLAVWRN